jgi:hypothetical protein
MERKNLIMQYVLAHKVVMMIEEEGSRNFVNNKY